MIASGRIKKDKKLIQRNNYFYPFLTCRLRSCLSCYFVSTQTSFASFLEVDGHNIFKAHFKQKKLFSILYYTLVLPELIRAVDIYVIFWYYKVMKRYNPVCNIELFHLLFLDQLSRKLNKNMYALKGGCNLRFFLKSVRYSQDIDFDIQQVRVDTLRNTIHKLIESTPFSYILRAHGIAIVDFSEPKQTETTQRWKLTLQVKDSVIPLHTKIEFSRREGGGEMLFDTIDPMVIQEYNLAPIYINHYIPEVALRQKIQALIGRTQTQARDIFDIHHLFKMGVKLINLPSQTMSRLDQAESNALSLSFNDFKSQVIAYLPYEYQSQYDDQKVWDNMVLEIIEKMKK